MWLHYLELGWRATRSHKALSLLIVLAIGMGIGASMTTLTVFRALSGDPLPGKSERLFYVQLDAQTRGRPAPDNEPVALATRFDAEALLRERRGDRQAMMVGGAALLATEAADARPELVTTRHTSADFFAMFEVPFAFGSGWSGEDDQREARVAVISSELNQRLFGGADSRGRRLLVAGQPLTIVGVLAPWRPAPHFYDIITGRYAQAEQLYLPFSTALALKLGFNGSMRCWGETNGDSRGLNAACAWLQYWVELGTPQKEADYRRYLANYSEQQRAAGRFDRPANPRLRNVMDWLAFNRVVPGDVKLQLWLSFGFLLVCLTNTVGLLLATSLRRAPEIGVRRALGATRGAIFAQFLAQAGGLGLAGGAVGLALAALGLWAVRLNPVAYADLARLDGTMLLVTLAASLAASLLAGLLPAWHACRVMPALHLKTQ
ncbi:MAG: ABC transporter permease [Bacteroidia bacterium]|jgi:putative ABC transport system permease protein